MFPRLLVCTDGSPYGETACDYALLLARALGSQLKALHVLDVRLIEGPLLADVSGMIGAAEYFASMPQFKELMSAKGQAVCDGFAAKAAGAAVKAECTVETGHPFHMIMTAEEACDLLILGRRGENESFGRDLIGSVTERIMRRARKTCLITPLTFKPVTHLLAATDGSMLADKAVQVAAQVASQLGAALTVLTVAEKIGLEAARHTAETAVERARAWLPGVAYRVKEGEAAEGIMDVAVGVNADLLVLGAHSHARVREWFVGCTTQRVLADSALPVLLVR